MGTSTRGNISNAARLRTNSADASGSVFNVFLGGPTEGEKIRDNYRDHRLRIEKKMDFIELAARGLKKCTVIL